MQAKAAAVFPGSGMHMVVPLTCAIAGLKTMDDTKAATAKRIPSLFIAKLPNITAR